MLEIIKESYDKVKESDEYKDFINNNPKSYLCSCFLFSDDDWQLDFYNPESKKITSFIVTDKIEKSEEDDIFRKDKKDLNELKLEEVKIDLDKALEIFEEKNDEKYKEEAEKKIIILQTVEKLVWNITYITKKFNILNMKIDVVNGEILDESLKSVMSFKT